MAKKKATKQEKQVKTLQTEVRSVKHEVTKKHSAAHTTKHKTAKRGYSPDEAVALCAARAVAEHLRIVTGTRVSDEDVLALHRAAGGDDEHGAPILAVLQAAARTGLSGLRVAHFQAAFTFGQPGILGIRLPDGRTHCLAIDERGVSWSWGEEFDPAGISVEEAWSARWAA